MRKITKADVGTFLGMVGVALISTIINKFNSETTISNTVKAALNEERRQIYEAQKNAQIANNEDNGTQE